MASRRSSFGLCLRLIPGSEAAPTTNCKQSLVGAGCIVAIAACVACCLENTPFVDKLLTWGSGCVFSLVMGVSARRWAELVCGTTLDPGSVCACHHCRF